MRKLGMAVALLVALSAANVIDAGVARRQYCEDRYQNVYLAARQAVHDSGARIVHSNESSGTIVGRVDAEISAHVIEVSVWITRDRVQENRSGDPIWVQVKAKFKKIKDRDLDEEQLELLEIIEDRIFSLIQQRAACGKPS